LRRQAFLRHELSSLLLQKHARAKADYFTAATESGRHSFSGLPLFFGDRTYFVGQADADRILDK
jgi:hypothetical protein